MTDIIVLRKDAKLAYRSKAYPAAAELYDRLVAMPDAGAPEAAAADRVGYASALLALDRLQEAAAQLEMALAALPAGDKPRIHLKLGEILARLGRHEDAVQHLADAVRLAPESADNNWRLALELRNLGREREAAVALRRCLEIDPNHTQGRILEIEQLALNAPERDGQFEEIAPFEADRTEPQISDQLLRRATAGRAASRDAAVLARAEATRPVSLFAQPWFLVVQAVALVLLALWLRTLFP